MRFQTTLIAMVCAVLAGGGAWWLAGRTRAGVGSVRPPSPSAAVLPPDLFISTESDSSERVRHAFPNGVATEDARAEIGTAPPPPDDDAPDGTQSFVVKIALSAPVSAARARAALPESDAGRTTERWVKGRSSGTGKWVHVRDMAAADATFSRLAVIVDLIDLDKAVDVPRLERELQWAQSFASKLDAAVPTSSMTPRQAAAKAQGALDARKEYSDEAVDVGVVIAAPKSQRFPGKRAWDAVYSAGFTWGDGDYFHWVPSQATDVSQGISMGTTTGSGYFLPESLAATDGTADVDDLEMSFNAARCWQPAQVFDVMARAAAYLARRLGGTVTTSRGTAFDPHAERLRVIAIEQGLLAHGVTPGAELALHVF